MHELEPIFNPRSIAVIGASRREGTIGQQVTKNLIDGGSRPHLPDQPGATEILGLKNVSLHRRHTGAGGRRGLLRSRRQGAGRGAACEGGVGGHIVITSGFAEVGNKKDEEDWPDRQGLGRRVIGPNIVGTMSNPAKANASFAPVLPYNGQTALISQSGALIIALDTVTFIRRFGVSSMISLGNMADLDFADCIEYYAQDPNTKCIALYIEGVKNGYKFMQAGRWAGKPIVALKAGVSAHGAAAAASHTGSLAGSVKVYQAACNQSHMIWATDLEDMLNKSQALAMQPVLKGGNVVIITNGGGSVLGRMRPSGTGSRSRRRRPTPRQSSASSCRISAAPRTRWTSPAAAAWPVTRGRSRPRSSPPGWTASASSTARRPSPRPRTSPTP
jgi:acetyltransferase